MLELERTFLAKFLPKGLEKFPSKEIIDIYLPKSAAHPVLRIRKNGNKFEITKKQPVDLKDFSKYDEQSISLSQEEFNGLAEADGKKIRKIRFFYPCNGKTAEIDIFLDYLEGLVLVDIEFETEEEKNSFPIPDFCLADVTQEKAFAGGMLCGKSFRDVEEKLKEFRYRKIQMN